MRDIFVDALIEEQKKVADESLRRVGTGDPAFEYGYRVGMYAGMDRAIQRVLAIYRDDKDEDIYD